MVCIYKPFYEYPINTITTPYSPHSIYKTVVTTSQYNITPFTQRE